MKAGTWRACAFAICSVLFSVFASWASAPGSTAASGRRNLANLDIDPAQKGVLPRRAATKRAATNELLVRLRPGTDAARFARDYGLALIHRLRSDANAI